MTFDMGKGAVCRLILFGVPTVSRQTRARLPVFGLLRRSP
jgi:hypothetical protein